MPNRKLALKTDAEGLCKIPLPKPGNQIRQISLELRHTNYCIATSTLERMDSNGFKVNEPQVWFPKATSLAMRRWENTGIHFATKVVQAGTSNAIANVHVHATIFARNLPNRELDLVTDAAGLCNVPLPMEGGCFVEVISLNLVHTNYVAKSATLQLSSDISKAYDVDAWKLLTIELAPEAIIGGVVRDDQSRPVAGARVYLETTPSPSVRYDRHAYNYTEFSHLVPSFVDLGKDRRAVAITDANGRWNCPHFPSDAKWVQVEVRRSDGSRESFATPPSEGEEDAYALWKSRQASGLVDLAELRQNKAVITLSKGVNLSGKVVDFQGKPIQGAILREGRENDSQESNLAVYRTDAQGRFLLTHRRPGKIVLTASASGLACASLPVLLNTHDTNVLLQLPAMRPLRARVVDREDAPISGATMSAQASHGHVLRWTGTTDTNGWVTWSNAPLQEAEYTFTDPKHRTLRAILTPTETIQTLTLGEANTRPNAIWFRVEDADTFQPIDRFVVYSGTNIIIQGTHGQAHFPHEGMDPLQIKADGYQTAEDSNLYLDIDHSVRILMHKHGLLKGSVMGPDGQPLAGTQIRVELSRSPLFISSDPIPGGVETYFSDASGHYEMPMPPDSATVGFIQKEGYYIATVGKLEKSPNVRLQPWGRLEGQLKAGWQIAKNQHLRLNSFRYSSTFPVFLSSHIETDKNGKFQANQIPAGEYVLHREAHVPSASSDLYPLHLRIEPGQTTQVIYGDSGRTVKGQIQSEPFNKRIIWYNDVQFLELKVTKPTSVHLEHPSGVFDIYSQSPEPSPEQVAYARAQRAYNLEVDRDGNFTADFIPPGKYWLKIRLSPWTYRGTLKSMPFLNREVVIPEAEAGHEDEPVDLGIIKVPCNLDEGVQAKDGIAH